MRETRVRSLGGEDLLEKEMATHSSILAWKIPWMEEPGRLQSMGWQRVKHDWETSLHLSEFSICLEAAVNTQVGLRSSEGLIGARKKTCFWIDTPTWLLAGGLSSYPSRALQTATWVSSRWGWKFPLWWVIWARKQRGSHIVFYALVLEVAHCHSCHILFITSKSEFSPYSELWEGGTNLWFLKEGIPGNLWNVFLNHHTWDFPGG